MSRRLPAPRRAVASPNRFALSGLTLAIATLLSDRPGPRGDAACAEREQLHRDAQKTPQCELPLRGHE